MIKRKSDVFFVDFTSTFNRNITKKIQSLLDHCGASQIIRQNAYVAVKVHFGEHDNYNFLRPQYVRLIVDYIKTHGGKPFLTDTNTLYSGKRANAVEHIQLAIEHGFGVDVTGAPIIIADGIAGEDYIEVPVNAKHTKRAKIGTSIANADALFVVTHFKGHEQMGFGGALKNLGMGCAARLGKLFMHSSAQPYIKEELCAYCQVCGRVCPVSAIYYENDKARIDYTKCTGCGECIIACHFGAIKNQWDESLDILSEKVAEYSLALARVLESKIFYINFLMNISPDCDCWSYADAPIVPDIGILGSFDPVALDRASADLVNSAIPIGPKGQLRHTKGGTDIIRATHPEVNWEHQLIYAEQIGLGTNDYNLIEIK